MRTTLSLAVGACLAIVAHVTASESTVARTSILASANVQPRTSLAVSTDVLRFEITDPYQDAEAVVTFSAGARASASSEVLLAVSANPIGAGGSTSDAELTVSSGANTQPIVGGERAIAAQWTGGGLRSGQLRFRLRAAPGTYVIPVRLQLIVP
jgi:hypothetical protein